MSVYTSAELHDMNQSELIERIRQLEHENTSLLLLVKNNYKESEEEKRMIAEYMKYNKETIVRMYLQARWERDYVLEQCENSTAIMQEMIDKTLK